MDVLIEIILEGILYGLWNLLKKGYYFLRKTIFGIPFPKNSNQEEKKLERKYLYRKIKLTDNINLKLTKSMSGELVEVISKDLFFAEFRDEKGNLIEFKNELVHKISRSQFEIIK